MTTRRKFFGTALGSIAAIPTLPQVLENIELTHTRQAINVAYHRQSNMLHVLVDDKDWDVTDEELRAIVQMFQAADLSLFHLLGSKYHAKTRIYIQFIGVHNSAVYAKDICARGTDTQSNQAMYIWHV